jgi:arylsulfatase A-like enzyme
MKPFATSVAIVLGFAGCLSAAEPQQQPAHARPNIIFILADDLSYGDLSCFGQKHFSTPHIDRLAEEGRIFANAYAGGPWCAPSRTALLTGLNTLHFMPPAKGRFNPTVAEMLKAAGYATCALGKWHMFEPHDSWFTPKDEAARIAGTNWAQMPWHRGFDVCRIGYRCGFLSTNGNPYFPWQIETGDRQEIALPENRQLDAACLWKYTASRYDAEGRFLDKSGRNSSQMRYAEDIYRDEAVKFLRAAHGRPFFLYYATPLVHGPLDVKQLAQFKDTADWTLRHKLWATMVQELDRSVGILMDEVRKLGLEKNTLVMFASDNGYAEWSYFGRPAWSDDPIFHNKGPWNRGKFITTNGGVIVPMLAWGPGRVPAHSKTSRAVCFYDFLATAAELSGAKPLGSTDGVSFLPLLEGRDSDQPLRPALRWASSSSYWNGISDDWAAAKSKTIYRPDAVLLNEKWYAIKLGQSTRLFDIAIDPGMEHDVSAGHAELRARAEQEFAKMIGSRKRG